MRVLITGSRSFTDPEVIQQALLDVCRQPPVGVDGGKPLLVSGACPDGADALCEAIALLLGWEVERHPADWDGKGKAAGYARNAAMVALGADVCLAFLGPCVAPRCAGQPAHGSHGTKHCAGLARDAGIPVRWYQPAPVKA